MKNKIFPLPLKISPVDTDGNWKLNSTFQYVSSDGTVNIEVPKGFVTNFATVPKLFRSIMSPWGKHGNAAVIHDYLYSIKGIGRKLADKIFLKALKDSGVGFFKRQGLYYMVRTFGWYFRETK